jgi:hypothetical protein
LTDFRVVFLRNMPHVFAMRQYGAETVIVLNSFRAHDGIYLQAIFLALSLLQRTISVADNAPEGLPTRQGV